MTRTEIEISLHLLETEYVRIANEYYEFRKNEDVDDFQSKKDEYLKQLCDIEDRIAENKRQLKKIVENVNRTCSRTRCAQCINHNNCEMEYAD